MNLRTLFGALVALAGLASFSMADLTYVDADVNSNTTLADGTALVDGVHYSSTSTAGDDLWNLRSFANGGTVISSNDSGAEDGLRLRTEINSLVAGQTYNISAYFWGAENSQWRGRASLTNDAGDLPGFNTFHTSGSSFSPLTFVTSNTANSTLNPGPLSTADGAGFENGGYFDNTVLTEEGNRSLYEAQLGFAVADSNGTIFVYIDDLADVSNINRTWYDGVGFQAVPEPATIGILVGLAFGFSVRRKR